MYDINLLQNITRIRTLHYRKDLDEVLLLASSTPALTNHLPEVQEVINWFDRVFTETNEHEELTGYWFDFVNMVLQRYSVLFTTELTAADNLVRNLFNRFFKGPLQAHVRVSYRENVTPLVFLGRGGSRSYYTLPPTVHRPLAIIHLPRAALNNVWRWTVLAHETGHDVFFSVDNLAREMDMLVTAAVKRAISKGTIHIPPVRAVLHINGAPVVIEMSPEQFAVSLWSRWINELFADLFALLMCGPACILTMQELLGFRPTGIWHGLRGPDPHPVPLLRNMINLVALRIIGLGGYAEWLERRMYSHVGVQPEIFWFHNNRTEVARASLAELMRLAEAVVDVMLHTPLQSFNNYTMREIINYDYRDQAIVNALALALTGSGTVPPGIEERHLAAAAQFAFAEHPYKADEIHNNVLKLLAY